MANFVAFDPSLLTNPSKAGDFAGCPDGYTPIYTPPDFVDPASGVAAIPNVHGNGVICIQVTPTSAQTAAEINQVPGWANAAMATQASLSNLAQAVTPGLPTQVLLIGGAVLLLFLLFKK